MKKILYAIIIFFISTISIKADYKVTNYRIDMTILDNGDINIKEAFKMDGEYNGFERIIDYKNNYNNYYGDNIASVDKKLYDGSSLKIEEVKAINYNNDEITEIAKYGDPFILKDDIKKGEHGFYNVIKTPNGEKIKIYNPSKMNKDFYLEYTLKNMVITHKDISELGMFIFTNLNENINNIEIDIHVPKNNKKLMAWTHKKNPVLIENNNVKIKIQNINIYEKFDIRIIFDNIKSNKKTDENVIEKIINLENNLSDKIYNHNNEYNLKKEQAYKLVNKVNETHNRQDYNEAYKSVMELDKDDELKTKLLIKLISIEPKIERKEVLIKVLLTSIMTFWIIGLMLFLYYFYKKYTVKINKENSNPKLVDPALVGYLFKKKITINDLVASLIFLINKEKIKYEKKGKTYKFFINDLNGLTNSENKLIHFIFNDKEEININQIKKKSKKDFDNYLKLYSNWIDAVSCEANEHNYFCNLFVYKTLGIMYSILGIILGSLLINKDVYFNSIYLIIISTIFLIFFILLYKRDKCGKEQYLKWKKQRKNIDEIYLLSMNKLKTNNELINDLQIIFKNSLKNAKTLKKSLYE